MSKGISVVVECGNGRSLVEGFKKIGIPCRCFASVIAMHERANAAMGDEEPD
jgi:hypothetical protein